MNARRRGGEQVIDEEDEEYSGDDSYIYLIYPNDGNIFPNDNNDLFIAMVTLLHAP